MQTIKKHLARIVAFCLLFGAAYIPTANAAAEDVSNDNLALLYSLGIYSASDEMELVNEPLTRETIASILSVFYGVVEDSYPVVTPFEDVSEDWASGHIMTMVNNGIMSGYDDGLFRPDTYVEAQDAVKMLVTMLGRNVMAELKGGYPKGYVLEAQQCGMLKGIDATSGTLSKGEFTKLLVNALDIKVLEQVTYGHTNAFSYENKNTLLSDKLDIYKAAGTVNATDYVSITYGSPASEGCALIGGEVFKSEIDLYDYLATEVEFYYRKSKSDSVGEVLYVESYDNKNVVDIDAKDISTVNYVSGEFSYFKNDKIKKVELASDVIVIFNGKRITYYTDEHLKPKQGSVRLITNGAAVEYIIINCEVDYIVDTVSRMDDAVYISDLNGKISLKCNEERDRITLTDNGAKLEIKSLKKGDVLTVSADSVDFAKSQVKQDSKVFKIVRSANKVTGVLERINDDTAYIDGKECTLAYAAKDTKPKVGGVYTGYINYRGEIMYFEEGGAEKEIFGIIHKWAKEGTLDERIYLKIYTQDGKMTVSELDENVLVDGVKYRDKNQAFNAVKAASVVFTERANASLTGTTLQVNDIWQLAKFKINDENKIKSIDTIVENRTVGENDLTLFMSRPKEDTTKAHANGIYYGSGSISGEIGYGNDTIFFETGAPSNRTENSYRTFKGSAYTNTSFAFLAAFCANDMNVCDVVLRVYSTDISSNIDSLNSANVMLLDSVEYKVEEDGSTGIYACGYYLNNGAAASVPVENANLLDGMEGGDFIRYSLGGDGKISAASLYFDNSNPNIDFAGNDGKYSAEVRVSYGTVVARDESFLLTWFDLDGNGVKDATDWLEPRSTTYTTSIFIFDRRTNTISKAKLDDICTERVHGIGDKVAAFYTSGRMPTVVIYRN